MLYSGSRRREWLTHCLIFHLGCPFNHKLKFENAYISMRLGLSFHTNTLSVFIENASIRKRSWEWIKTKTHTYSVIVDGRKRIKIKTTTENIACACVNLYHVDRVQLTSQRAILSFSNTLVWTVKNASKRKCGHDSIDAFSMTTKTR